jgi:hypothetical protein
VDQYQTILVPSSFKPYSTSGNAYMHRIDPSLSPTDLRVGHGQTDRGSFRVEVLYMEVRWMSPRPSAPIYFLLSLYHDPHLRHGLFGFKSSLIAKISGPSVPFKQILTDQSIGISSLSLPALLAGRSSVRRGPRARTVQEFHLAPNLSTISCLVASSSKSQHL